MTAKEMIKSFILINDQFMFIRRTDGKILNHIYNL